ACCSHRARTGSAGRRAAGVKRRIASRRSGPPQVPSFFLSSSRRHTSFDCDWSSDGALPISASEVRGYSLTLRPKRGAYRDEGGEIGRASCRERVDTRGVGPPPETSLARATVWAVSASICATRARRTGARFCRLVESCTPLLV